MNTDPAGYSTGQRNAANWVVRHANLWREERESDQRLAALEEEVAELRRLLSGEQVQ